MRREAVDIGEIAAEVCGSARRIADEKGIVFAATIQPGPLAITGDPDAIRRLFLTAGRASRLRIVRTFSTVSIELIKFAPGPRAVLG